MRERRSPPPHHRWTLLILAGAGALSTALSGCGNEDPHSAAIRAASYRLDALSPRSAAAASDTYVAQECQQIIQGLRPITSSGNATQKAAANQLIARAQFGIALPKIEAARLLQRHTRNKIEVARSLYDRLLMQRALEIAANNYDPAPEQTEITKELALVSDQVTAAQTAKAKVDAAVSALRANAGTKRAESQTHRAAEAALRQQVLTTDDFDEAARLMVRTQEARRKADALDVAASDLEAQADQQAPESIEIARQIERYQNQASLLAQSRQEVTERARRAKEDAATAAADAAETHGKLVAAVTDIASIYDSEMLLAVDEAVSSLGQASSAASQARSVIQLATEVMGEAQQAIGDLQWATAELCDSYAGFVGVLANTSPGLPGLGDLAAAEQAASQAFTDRIRLAAEALNRAADALTDQELSDSLRSRANAFSARAGDPVQTPEDFGDPAEDDPNDPADPSGDDNTGGTAG